MRPLTISAYETPYIPEKESLEKQFFFFKNKLL